MFILQKIKKSLILFAVLIMANYTFAQVVTISGVVKDSVDKTTMVGVNILQKGTLNGTTTDVDGKYKLDVPKGSYVVFSFLGYDDKVVQVNKTMTLNVFLQNESTLLDEAIVIGYSTQRKSDKTGAVATVKADDLNGGVITDPIQAMQGKAAGVTITKKGGDPNEGYVVRIRGASGYESNTQPLYVIDGVPGADPTLLSPDDIESYNILKDAASTAIYGSRGANGVIIITTKKGKGIVGDGDSYSNVSFNTQASFGKVANKVKLLDADQYRAYAKKYIQDSSFTDGGANTDWQDEIYRTGVSYTTSLNLSGGNAKSSYSASLARSTWDGVMKGTSKERTTARLSLSHNAFDDRVTFSGGIIAAFENNDYESYSEWGKEDIIYQALSRNPTDPVYNPDGTYYQSNREFNYENPIAVINEVTNLAIQNKVLGNFRTDFKLTNDIVLSANTSYIKNTKKKDYFRPANLYAGADPGHGKKEYSDFTQKLIELTANYTKTFKKVHNVEALAGYSYQENEVSGFFAQGNNAFSDWAGPDNLKVLGDVVWGDIDSWRSSSKLIGFFGRAQYNYDRKYYLSTSIRRDGSSKFGENNKWGWFPTVALGWNIHKEKFMKGYEWLDQLKLRGSYGVAGNQEIGEYKSLLIFEPSGKAVNPETGQKVVTFKPAHNANSDLKWEETAEYNFGIDFAFLNNKLSGSFEVYQKNTSDLLGSYAVPVPPNLARTTWANSGSIQNKGMELYLQAYAVNKKRFNWKTSLNIARNKTYITDLGSYVDGNIRKEGYITGRGLVGDELWVTGLITGEEAGAFHVPEYVTLKNGEFVYKSSTGGYTTDASKARRYTVGTAAPDVEIGWSNSITFFKRWNFDFAFRSMIGNYVYNATAMFFDDPSLLPELNALEEEAQQWKEDGRVSPPSLADIYVENASFLKLDFIALVYNFDVSSKSWINSFSVFVSGNNLFTITGYSGIDPETSIDGLSYGIDQYNVYPKTRSVTFGLKALF